MKQYDVKGMSCAACQARVERAVSRVPGVTACSVNLLTNSMGVEGDVSPEDVIRAVKNAGYGASEKGKSRAEESGQKSDSLRSFQTESIQNLKHRLILSVVFLCFLMYITMGHHMLGLPLPSFFIGNYLALTLTQMLLALIVMIINRDFFVSGFRAVRHLSPNMDTLVAFGSSVSFGWSLFVFYKMTDLVREGAAVAASDTLKSMYHDQLYFESAAMIPALITVGKLLEAIAKGRTTNALESLMRLAPKTAVLLRDGEEVRVAIEEVKTGDRFVVKPGQILPADGFVVEGEGTVNESSLTGESDPVEKGPEARVSAATIAMSGRLVCCVTRVGEDTTMSQIIQMVSEASATKAPIARIADKVSGVFVPVVILIALLVICGWLIAGESISVALARGICVLVISCPCALGLATPVAIMVGNGIGAGNGILFKTGEALETCGRVSILVTDKTGTITYGDPERTGVIREDSKEAIRGLKNLGLRVVMLSGDKQEKASMIANEVGVDEVIAEVLPDGKEGHVREIMKSGRTAMVGDGINDAPALTVADVGIAIGDGTDVAIDSADVVLMNSTLNDVVKAIRLSRMTLRTIHQNLFWAFFYNIIYIPMAAGLYGWQMNPMWGAAAMALSSVTVCLNALRLNLTARKLNRH